MMTLSLSHSYSPVLVASSLIPSQSGWRMFHLVNGNDSKSFMSFIFNITILLPLYDGTNTCRTKNTHKQKQLQKHHWIIHTLYMYERLLCFFFTLLIFVWQKRVLQMTYFFSESKHFRENLLCINLMGQTQIHAYSFRLFEWVHI